MDENTFHGSGAPEKPVVDTDQVLEFWRAMVRPGDVHEMRVPKPRDGRFGVLSGYFDNYQAFVHAVRSIRGDDAEGVYMTLNPATQALLARAANRLQRNAKTLTSDGDILHYRNLLIDIDPVRPAGISATDAERQRALETGEKIVAFLCDQGWPLPVVHGSSGNGGMLVYRLSDLPNSPESRKLIKRVLESLSEVFNTADVTIDTTVSNPSRLVKIVGTVAAKRDHTADRPWHRAEGVCRVD